MTDIEKPLLICQLTEMVTDDTFARLNDHVKKLGDDIGCKVVVSSHGMTMSYMPPIGDLVNAIREQAAAIDNMAASLGELTAILADDLAGDEEGPPARYLDGSPVDVPGDDDQDQDELEVPQAL